MKSRHGSVCVELRPSRGLPRLLALTHGASLVLVAFAWPISVPSVALLAAIFLHGLWTHARVLRRVADDVVRVELDGRGEWRLGLADGSALTVELRAAPLVLPWLTALSFRAADARRFELLLLPDRVEADAFRRLRIRLLRLRAGES